MREHLGVDELLFLDMDGLVEAVTRKGKHAIKTPCMACMNGQYVTGNINAKKIEQLQQDRQRCRGEECVY
jgi:amidophosphoribosyltransferase